MELDDHTQVEQINNEEQVKRKEDTRSLSHTG